MRSMTLRWGSFGALIIFCLWGFHVPAMAQTALPASGNGGLLVSPTYVLFDGRARSTSLLLTNRGNATETYRVSIINRRQMPDGQLVETEQPAEGEGFASPLVRYAPREVVLQPNKPQTVRLLLQTPSDLHDGEYRSHILVQQVPTASASDALPTSSDGISVSIRAIFGITVPLIVRKGRLAASATLSDLRVIKLADDRHALALKLNRTGARSLRGDITVQVDGKVVGQLNGVNVFLSTPYRELLINLTEPDDFKGRRLSVAFSEGEETGGTATASQAIAP
jgi:P pilus assembly chaperone PapD